MSSRAVFCLLFCPFYVTCPPGTDHDADRSASAQLSCKLRSFGLPAALPHFVFFLTVFLRNFLSFSYLTTTQLAKKKQNTICFDLTDVLFLLVPYLFRRLCFCVFLLLLCILFPTVIGTFFFSIYLCSQNGEKKKA